MIHSTIQNTCRKLNLHFNSIQYLLAKFGLMSIRLARGPVDTAPLTPVAAVRHMMPAIELQPENARPSTNNPWPIQPL